MDGFIKETNKNIGDTFLLVWKYDENFIDKRFDGSVEFKVDQSLKEISDLPVLSFVRIIVGINMSKKLDKYRENVKLKKLFRNYDVSLGFGLHVGWGIEVYYILFMLKGAIGSNFKIDASYLSPNVNMSSRLEAATK